MEELDLIVFFDFYLVQNDFITPTTFLKTIISTRVRVQPSGSWPPDGADISLGAHNLKAITVHVLRKTEK